MNVTIRCYAKKRAPVNQNCGMFTSVIPPSTRLPDRGVFVCRCLGKWKIPAKDTAPDAPLALCPCSVRIVLPDDPTLNWTVRFVCAVCQEQSFYKEEDILEDGDLISAIQKLDLSTTKGWEECEKYGQGLKAECLWRLQIKDSREIVHTIAPRNSLKPEFEKLVRIACKGTLGPWPEIERMEVWREYGDFSHPSRVFATLDR